ncbi:MAG: nitrite/sulfite reductase [Bacteroidota bacterium]
MKSFRTEFEDPRVAEDIVELEKKIYAYHHGQVDEEKFRSLRLARGVYGQRQPGVQIIRIKLPFGRVTSKQMLGICDVADRYSTGKLHITTRQDIQIHYVSLDDTPQLWAELEASDVTLREACGNTVRNVTASEKSGIDPEEAFDVTPHANAVFRYFLRNPVCQEMGRKIKISFSSSERDDALSYMHDLGFIATIQDGQRGFRAYVGGGLGSQPHHAELAFEFLPENRLIPFIESILRVFDQYGEREKRMMARMKFLLKKIGLEKLLALAAEVEMALPYAEYPIEGVAAVMRGPEKSSPTVGFSSVDARAFARWKKENVFVQKQAGHFAIGVKVVLGDFSTEKARDLARLIRDYGSDELRLTLRQNILIRSVQEAYLPIFFLELKRLGFVAPHYLGAGDITACPGTTTCNLGIANSTHLALELERVLQKEYPEIAASKDIAIKISGCMNACGQHMMADIGFQGMSLKGKDGAIAPAVQILLGGHNYEGGKARFSDKVIKVPSKRAPQALRIILDDFKTQQDSLPFYRYYEEKGKAYFYQLLKSLSDASDLRDEEYVDWGEETAYLRAIGIGECAGVTIDLVGTLLLEAVEKLDAARRAKQQQRYADSIYHSYSAMLSAAKALLTRDGHRTNSHRSIIDGFDQTYASDPQIQHAQTSFSELVHKMHQSQPHEAFATSFLQSAVNFQNLIHHLRNQPLKNETA